MTKAYSKRKLSRSTSHRSALLRNLSEALLMNEKIRTTLPRAKELRSFIEKVISSAKKGKAISYRNVNRFIKNDKVLDKLFDVIAPRYSERKGGYTQIFRLGYRKGDCAEIALIKLV